MHDRYLEQHVYVVWPQAIERGAIINDLDGDRRYRQWRIQTAGTAGSGSQQPVL